MSTIVRGERVPTPGHASPPVRHRTPDADPDIEGRRYRDLVRQVMLDSLRPPDGVRRAFRGSGAAMASAVADAMADLSFESLLVFSDALSPDVWDANRLSAFAVRTEPGSLRLLVLDPGRAESTLAAMSDLVASGRVGVRTLPAGLTLPRHVAVGDGRHVRVEDDPATRRATCVLGDREIGAQATEVFEALWSRASPLPR